ncbi:hypothetical protein IE077_000890 [Cardiosporidium cionae]|uniref:Uncharacterized protein n=1 Tax=Cardiosporidium cionae TaxID=476202 RepID=A0ABQ7J6E1_9APIC|nr:hypothetical protein IE077_000890 [Cardiosporidium cionae]|eukprot:KAF8819528.1 hypothetical protein IE077_000890 [Cardiosporidium cionae]
MVNSSTFAFAKLLVLPRIPGLTEIRLVAVPFSLLKYFWQIGQLGFSSSICTEERTEAAVTAPTLHT